MTKPQTAAGPAGAGVISAVPPAGVCRAGGPTLQSVLVTGGPSHSKIHQTIIHTDMAAETSFDFSIGNLVAGVFGAFVSLRFVQGTTTERVIMAIGGAALSYYATPHTATWLGMQHAEGLVGFLIGLFGMAITAKIYEAILAMPAAQIGQEVFERVRRFFWG